MLDTHMTKKLIKIAAVLILVSFGASVFYYYAPQSLCAPASPISDFQDERDTQDVLKIFEKDRYWLISSEDYDPAWALKTRSPHKSTARKWAIGGFCGLLHEKFLFGSITLFSGKSRI